MRLFDGFNLCAPETSVSMTQMGTIGGTWQPSSESLNGNKSGFLQRKTEESRMQPRLRNQGFHPLERKRYRSGRPTQRGDVEHPRIQPDTSLRMMGDVAEFYVNNSIRNHYFVSISGYHIAEAGANPITQAALTLANGLTYVELFKARGLDPDQFLRNFSWFSQMAWTQNMS